MSYEESPRNMLSGMPDSVIESLKQHTETALKDSQEHGYITKEELEHILPFLRSLNKFEFFCLEGCMQHVLEVNMQPQSLEEMITSILSGAIAVAITPVQRSTND